VIVLDEQLAAPDIAELFARWYPGQVLAVTALRPHARLLDPEIPGYPATTPATDFRYDQLSALLAQRFDAPALLHRLFEAAAGRRLPGFSHYARSPQLA